MDKRERWLARSELAKAAGVPDRLRLCGRRRFSRHVAIRAANGAAWYEGVVRCRTRTCPVCWVARRAVVAREISHVVRSRSAENQVVPLLATLTVRHAADDPVEICKEVRACWRKFIQGREWVKFRERWRFDWIAAEEVTRGANGWHPHMHLLLLPSEQPEAFASTKAGEQPAFAETVDWWHARWSGIVDRVMGSQHVPNRDHGADLRPCMAHEYLAKLGFELSDVGVQKGRAPLGLLKDGQTELYLQLQRSRHRCRDITWSGGLGELRGMLPPPGEAKEVLVLRGSEYERLAELGTDSLIDVLEGAAANEDEARIRAESLIGPLEGVELEDAEREAELAAVCQGAGPSRPVPTAPLTGHVEPIWRFWTGPGVYVPMPPHDEIDVRSVGPP